jgi:UDPglucose 6-dehydrogenase
LDELPDRVDHNPIAGEAAARRLPEPKVVFDPYDALAGAHAAIVVTEWKEFRELDLKRVASLMNRPPLLVDGRNVLDSAAVGAAGIRYRGFERG